MATKWAPASIGLGRRMAKSEFAIPVTAAVGGGAAFATALAVREIAPKAGLPLFSAPLITAGIAGITAAALRDWKFGAGAFAGIAMAYALDVFGVLRIPPR